MSGATRKPVADSWQNRFFFSARLFSQCWCEIRNHSWYISCSPRALLSLIYKLSRAISTLGRRLRALNSTREAQNKREPAALSIATDQNSIPQSGMAITIDDYVSHDDPLPSKTGGAMFGDIFVMISSFFSPGDQNGKNEEITKEMSPYIVQPVSEGKGSSCES